MIVKCDAFASLERIASIDLAGLQTMTPTVQSLSYIGYNAVDAAAWRPLLEDVFGLRRREDSQDGEDEYRLDERHHRIAIHSADTDGIAYLGFELDSTAELEAFAGRLDGIGVEYEWGSQELVTARAVSSLLVINGPDNIRLEVCAGLTWDHLPFVPSAPRKGYLTGAQGLGHVAIVAVDRIAAAKWYMNVFGFTMSDIVQQGPLSVAFLHCNGRHHSVGIAQALLGIAQAGTIHHLMLEAVALDDVGRGHDVMMSRAYPVAVTLGQHSNDLMVSFYVYTPSGNAIEYGFGGRVIEEDWQERYYRSGELWGHEFKPPPQVWPFPSASKK